MEYPPFGIDSKGNHVRDVSGVIVRANIDCLEDYVTRVEGADAASRAVKELCDLLNERISDSAYHVNPEKLKNYWNSYSYEFVIFLAEFCSIIANDPRFQFRMGEEKLIPPAIQILGRTFSIPQLYRMWPYFVEKYTRGSLQPVILSVTDCAAIIRLRLGERTSLQFGRYRPACAELICQSTKSGLAAIPKVMFGMKASAIHEYSCMADGADYCEWKFTWELQDAHRFLWPAIGLFIGTATFLSLRILHPSGSPIESLILSAFPAVTVWLAYSRRKLQQIVKEREVLIDEQLQSVETQHEELRQAYVEQGEQTVELKRRVGQLTMLHQTGTLFNSTHDREILFESALRALIKELHYDRAMVAFYDGIRKISHDARVLGVSEEIEKFARSIEVPVRDANSIEGMVLLRETPILVCDIGEVWDRMHPLTQQLISSIKTKSFISVPLKVNQRVIGSLTVDRVQEFSLTQDDLDMMMTLASQFSIALDNAEAYHQIEGLNIGLEAKVRERTLELEQANQKVKLQSTELAEWNKTLECRVKEQVAQVEKLGKLKRFFSPQLAELIIAGDAADPLKSHRRNITVVFLDLRGYTSFAETVAPEELMGMLQEFHETMGKTIMEYNGTLERFTGDGLMVFFNDPTPIPNPGEQAARMANTMRDQVKELKIKWAKYGYLLDLGIGIAHGHATIGAIGFEGRWDYAAIGPVTNLASRLCSEAQPGQILVSKQFLVTVEKLVEADFVGELTLKGFRQSITAYNITYVKP